MIWVLGFLFCFVVFGCVLTVLMRLGLVLCLMCFLLVLRLYR